MNELDHFICGNHSFTIVAAESCMIRTVTLVVAVKCIRGEESVSHGIEIFQITEGDHVWNTLVKDREQDGLIDLAPCVPYLHIGAEEFCREYPEPLEFGSAKKAARFSADVLRRPLNVRGNAYPIAYPGSTSLLLGLWLAFGLA